MKKISLFLTIILLLTTLTGCTRGYDYKWIKGKHYTEIIAKYGDFDGAVNDKDQDSRYNQEIFSECKEKNFAECYGYYIINSSNKLESSITDTQIQLKIFFNDNSTAKFCVMEKFNFNK